MAFQNFHRWGERSRSNIEQLESGGTYGPSTDGVIKSGENVFDTDGNNQFGFTQNSNFAGGKLGCWSSAEMIIVLGEYNGGGPFTTIPADRWIAGYQDWTGGSGGSATLVTANGMVAEGNIGTTIEMNNNAMGITHNGVSAEDDLLAIQQSGSATIDADMATGAVGSFVDGATLNGEGDDTTGITPSQETWSFIIDNSGLPASVKVMCNFTQM